MKLCYIANVNSPHVKEWLELLDENTSVAFATIENVVDEEKLEKYQIHIDEIIRPPIIVRYFPKQFQYVILGLILRLKRNRDFVFHAHNASGYGLSAAISGKPYLLTTYGSEIFHSSAKSKLYNSLIKFVLQRAIKVTATTQAMQIHLEKHFFISSNKISVFSLGVSNAFFSEQPVEKMLDADQGPIWFSNRRILPLYRTIEIVQAFIAFKSQGGKGVLILLQGDAEGEYFEQVISQISNRTDIRLVRGFVDTQTIISLLDEAHFTISIPKTDQLSSSILEPMARRCIPIVADLEAYKVLDGCLIKVDNSNDIQVEIEDVLIKTSSLSPDAYNVIVEKCHRAVTLNFRRDSLTKNYFDGLNLLGIKQ